MPVSSAFFVIDNRGFCHLCPIKKLLTHAVRLEEKNSYPLNIKTFSIEKTTAILEVIIP